MAFLVILSYQIFLEKKYLKIFFREFTTCYFAKKLSFIVTINILKFENHSSKNERFLLALFNFSLSALVLRTSASISFTAPPSGCVNNQKKTRATSSIPKLGTQPRTYESVWKWPESFNEDTIGRRKRLILFRVVLHPLRFIFSVNTKS